MAVRYTSYTVTWRDRSANLIPMINVDVGLSGLAQWRIQDCVPGGDQAQDFTIL